MNMMTISRSLCPFHQLWPKMVTNSFGNKFHAPNQKAQHALMIGPIFFLLGVRWMKLFFVFSPCPQCVLNMFSSCSHGVPQVPKLFTNTFPITPQFYPIWFCPKFNSHVYTLKRQVKGVHICFYFATRVQRGLSIQKCPMFQKNW